MSYVLIAIAFICSAAFLSGCNGVGGGLGHSDNAAMVPGGGLGRLRPKVDPKFVEMAQQEALAEQEQQALRNQAQAQAAQAAGQTQNDGRGGFSFDGLGRLLPRVNQDPISGTLGGNSAQAGNFSAINANGSGGTSPDFGAKPSGSAPMDGKPLEEVKPAEVATYGNSYSSPFGGGGTVPPPPPGALSGGSLSPPPPAVTLSTQANVAYDGAPNPNPYANPYANPYGNPYANPYLNPYAIPYQPGGYPPQVAPPQPERPAGLFGAGQGARRPAQQDDDAPVERKKTSNFVPIIPRGMDARSPYQQRDDLKILWKGAQGTSQFQEAVGRDGKVLETLARMDVGLPTDATRGSFNVNPRQVDLIFRPVALDKKVATSVRRVETDLVQSYYRYLYAYHKFALAQQTLSARKQEVEVSGSDAEKQRAAADVAQSQNDADSAKEDLKAAQMELSSVAGVSAARSIIGKVSGITPSSESLAVFEPAPLVAEKKNDGGFGFGSLFGFGNKAAAPKQEAPKEVKVVAPKAVAATKVPGKNDKKGGKGQTPVIVAAAQPDNDLKSAPEAPTPSAAASQSGISMELKGVNVTARKSVLTVAIKNNSENDFSFDPEAFAVSENNHKLAEAALRADFETTLVQPNQEVKGTITIFGRPWNDRLTVSLSDGSRNVQLRR